MRPIVLLFLLAAGLAEAAPTLRPGLWEITTQTTTAPVEKPPALSAAQRKQMAANGVRTPGPAGSGKAVTMKHCVTAEQAGKGAAPKAEAGARERCQHKDVKTTDDSVSWKIECSGEYRATGTGRITYSGAESYKGETSLSVQDARGNATATRQTLSARWLKDACK